MINTITIKYQRRRHTTKTLKQILVNLIKLLQTDSADWATGLNKEIFSAMAGP